MYAAKIPFTEREWVKLKDFASNGTYTVENMTKFTEVMVMFSNVYPRTTVLICPISLFKTTHIFPDFTFGGGRIYCDIEYTSDTSINVSSMTGIGTGSAFSLYAR